MSIIATIEKEQFKTDLVEFQVGDTVCVHTRVIEGDKERIQKYAGIVIGRKGTGINANFTVRRVSFGEGVERVFPLHSPVLPSSRSRSADRFAVPSSTTSATARARPPSR